MDLRAVSKLSYGLYVISSKLGDKINGQIANVVFQATAQPQCIAICLHKDNLTREYVEKSKVFSVSILSVKTPFTFIGNFGFKSGKTTDKFNGINFKPGLSGVPIVTDYSVGFLEAEVVNSMDAGTHTLYLGRITDAGIFNEDEPMTYDYYHKVIKGKASKNAPTYVQQG